MSSRGSMMWSKLPACHHRPEYEEKLLFLLPTLVFPPPLWCPCEDLRTQLSKRSCHLTCWLWAGLYPASISLHFQRQSLWGRIRGSWMEARLCGRSDRSSWRADPLYQGAFRTDVQNLPASLLSDCHDDLLGCLSPDTGVMLIRHVSGSGDAEESNVARQKWELPPSQS